MRTAKECLLYTCKTLPLSPPSVWLEDSTLQRILSTAFVDFSIAGWLYTLTILFLEERHNRRSWTSIPYHSRGQWKSIFSSNLPRMLSLPPKLNILRHYVNQAGRKPNTGGINADITLILFRHSTTWKYVEPLPEALTGNKWIRLQYVYSNFLVAIPVTDRQATAAARELFDRVFLQYGSSSVL